MKCETRNCLGKETTLDEYFCVYVMLFVVFSALAILRVSISSLMFKRNRMFITSLTK
jgi:hypothetical protein